LLQAKEKEGLILPVNNLITKKQCKGKAMIAVVTILSVGKQNKVVPVLNDASCHEDMEKWSFISTSS
jgi:hypothetical protein